MVTRVTEVKMGKRAIAASESPDRLRPDQRKQYERAASLVRDGKRVLVVRPTGTGKTWIGVEFILDAMAESKRVLVVVHRDHILKQTKRHLIRDGLHPRLVGNANELDKPVVIASVQSLARRTISATFDFVLVDEAHHATARTWRSALEKSGAKSVVGLTATPCRTDGSGLGDLFDEIVEGPTAAELIKLGQLANPKIHTVPGDRVSEIRKGVQKRGGDYDKRQASDRMRRTVILGDLIKHWRRISGKRPTIVFACDIRHARAVMARFLKIRVATEIVTGETKESVRDEIFARVRSGKTKLVVSVDVLGEGLDVDAFRCAVLARPTTSLTLYRQQCGRVMRPGPLRPVILDHAGNFYPHGYPTDPVQWTLEVGAPAAVGPRKERRCKACGEVLDPGVEACPSCGGAAEALREVEERSGKLVLAELMARPERHPSVTAKLLRQRIGNHWATGEALVEPLRGSMEPGRVGETVGSRQITGYAHGRFTLRCLKCRRVAIVRKVDLGRRVCFCERGPKISKSKAGRLKRLWRRWKEKCKESRVSEIAFRCRIRRGINARQAASVMIPHRRTGLWNKWKSLAIENDIRRGTFYYRIRSGLSPRQAATMKNCRQSPH